MCAGRSTTIPDSCTSGTGRDDDAFAAGGRFGVAALLAVVAFLAFGCGCSFGAALDWAGATAGAFGGVTGAAFGGVTGAICPVLAFLATAAPCSEDRFFAKGIMLSDELDDGKLGTGCTVASSWLEGCGNTGDVTVSSAIRAFFIQQIELHVCHRRHVLFLKRQRKHELLDIAPLHTPPTGIGHKEEYRSARTL